MQITITGRHVEITEPLRTHVEKKLGKLRSYSDHIMDMRVVLSVEKYRQFAEITIAGRHNTRFHSHETTDDMYVSIDKSIEKIERQLSRHTSRVRKAKRRKTAEAQPSTENSGEETPEPEETFQQHGSYRVSVSDKFPPKPMSVEEAVMQLEVSDDEFLAF